MKQMYNWEDDWILQNYQKFYSWSNMVKEYNNLFNTSFTRQQFKNHIQKFGLKLTSCYAWTSEMDEFLTINYPNLTMSELIDRFSTIFGPGKSASAIRNRVNHVGVKKDTQYIADKQRRAGQGRRVPVGTISKDSSGNTRIKMSEGKWISYAKYIYEKHNGQVPEGYAVLFLDGDHSNFDLSNLVAVPEGYNALLTAKLNIDRSCPELTKVAIKWCDLYTLLCKESKVD